MYISEKLDAGVIDYYPKALDRMETLRQLAGAELPRDSYLALRLPFPLGRLHDAMWEKLMRPEPGVTEISAGVNYNYIEYDPDYGDKGRHALFSLSRCLLRNTKKLDGDQCNQLKAKAPEIIALNMSLLNMQQRHLGNFVKYIRFDYDSRTLDPAKLKAPFIHQDFIEGQNLPQGNEPVLLPPLLKGMLLSCVFRVPAFHNRAENENLQVEYIDDTCLSRKSKPHPALLQALLATRQLHDLKREFYVVGIEAAQREKIKQRLMPLWQESVGLHRHVGDQLRREGLLRQAEPAEILLMSNWSAHRTHAPKHSQRSSFFNLGFAV